MTDNVYVDCSTCREALSARLDGEDEGVPADRGGRAPGDLRGLPGVARDRHLAEPHPARATGHARARPRRRDPRRGTPDHPARATGLATSDAAGRCRRRPADPRSRPGAGHRHVHARRPHHRCRQQPPVQREHGVEPRARPRSALDSAAPGRDRGHAARHGRVRRRADPLLRQRPASAAPRPRGRVLSHSLLLVGLALLALVHFRDRGPGSRTPRWDSDSTDTAGSSESPQRAEQPSTRRRVRLRPVSRRNAA